MNLKKQIKRHRVKMMLKGKSQENSARLMIVVILLLVLAKLLNINMHTMYSDITIVISALIGLFFGYSSKYHNVGWYIIVLFGIYILELSFFPAIIAFAIGAWLSEKI